MSNHEEFSIMTPAAQAAHDAAVNAIQGVNTTISCGDLRRALAAFQREAIRQVGKHEKAEKSDWHLVWGNLEAIAASLHNPPPPPTLADAREAARQLAGPSAEIVHAFLATLGEAGQT